MAFFFKFTNNGELKSCLWENHTEYGSDASQVNMSLCSHNLIALLVHPHGLWTVSVLDDCIQCH